MQRKTNYSTQQTPQSGNFTRYFCMDQHPEITKILLALIENKEVSSSSTSTEQIVANTNQKVSVIVVQHPRGVAMTIDTDGNPFAGAKGKEEFKKWANQKIADSASVVYPKSAMEEMTLS